MPEGEGRGEGRGEGGGEGEVGSHGVVSAPVTQSVPEDVEAEVWSTSLCLRGRGRKAVMG